MLRKVKRFQIDVETLFDVATPVSDEEGFTDAYPTTITDLEENYADAMEGYAIAEIEIVGEQEASARFRLNLDDIEAVMDVLIHIRDKVLEKKPKDKTEAENEQKQ